MFSERYCYRNFMAVLAMLLCHIAVAQHNSPLTCEGEIPEIFRNEVSGNATNFIDYYAGDAEKFDEDKNELITLSALNASMFYKNGVVLFGDEITNYLNQIKELILQDDPELNSKVSVYTLKSADVNAHSTLEGNIFVTLGLLSRINSEAELAFVLAHEISHFKLKHVIRGVSDKNEIEEIKKDKRKNLSFEDMLKLRMKRSKTHEFEADSLGYLIYAKSPYAHQGAIDLLNVLDSADLPISQKQFETDFFNDKYLTIPDPFFKEQTDEITSSADESDVFLTHPNIKRRKEAIERLSTRFPAKGQEMYSVSVSNFHKMQKASSIELIRVMMSYRRCGEAMYTAYILMEKYPDEEEYFKDAIAKALYSLAKYKNANEFHHVAYPYTKVEGKSQNLHYFLKHMTSTQLSTIAIKELYKRTHITTPNPLIPYLLEDLVVDHVVQNNVSPDDYWGEEEALRQNKEFFGLPVTHSGKSTLKLRKKYSKFYRLALAKEKNDEELRRFFIKGEEKLNKKKERRFLSYKERKKAKKNKKKEIRKEGYKINARDVIVIEPEYFDETKKIDVFLGKSEKAKHEFTQTLNKQVKKAKDRSTIYLNSTALQPDDVEAYNSYSLAKNIKMTQFNNYIPTYISNADDLMNDHYLGKYKYYLSTYVFLTDTNILHYQVQLIEIPSGKELYKSQKKITLKKIKKALTKDFDNIFN